MPPDFVVRLADTARDLHAAQRLRYDVFVKELGGTGEMVDHTNRLECDRFDPYFDHLLLLDRNLPEDQQVVGVYRLLRESQARAAGQYYSEDEYDLDPLRKTGRSLLELGRSCLRHNYRGGTAMYHLWGGLSEYIRQHKIEILFGVASFHGTDIARLSQPLSLLRLNHLAARRIAGAVQGSATDGSCRARSDRPPPRHA